MLLSWMPLFLVGAVASCRPTGGRALIVAIAAGVLPYSAVAHKEFRSGTAEVVLKRLATVISFG